MAGCYNIILIIVWEVLMKLIGLLESIDYNIIQGELNINIVSINHDSRLVEKDGLFICIDGLELDGHKYIEKAIERGAIAIMVTKDIELPLKHITVIKVDDSREILAKVATKFYNCPTNQFRLVGVTGTNGKTSTVFLIDRILQKAGKKTGIIGTIRNKIGDKILETEHTTPDALELQKLFSYMVEANVNDVVMEVSSHALDLKRVVGAEYDVAVFTNLTLDHLDYHKTMEAYREAKLILFKMADTAVINIDDTDGCYILEQIKSKNIITYSCENSTADLYASDIKIDINGTHFKLNHKNKTYTMGIQTPGKFSVYNALAAIGAVLQLNIPIEIAKEALAEDSIVEGRFEVISSPKGYNVIVDYAHAPDGLENVLQTIKEFAKGRIITVFGCGGDRDTSKRPIMGEIAGRLSDYTILTSDNPRTEDSESIIKEVEAGIITTNADYEKITDRTKAIHHGLEIAKRNDIILVAGKGHEDYQVIGKTKVHLDDREIIRTYMQEA